MKAEQIDAVICNHAPDVDSVSVSVGPWKIWVDRDELGDVSITVKDVESGAEERCLLGKEGKTTKL